MATEYKVLDIPLPCAADQSAKQYYAMALNGSGNAALATAQGQSCIGILQDDPSVAAQSGTYRVLGQSKCIYGGTVDENDPLTTDANGKLIKATSNAEHVLGRCMKAGVTGDIGEIMLGITNPPAGATGYVLSLPITLAGVTAADVLTTFTPGHKGKITAVAFAVTTPVTTAAKAASLNLEIGTTNLTGGVVALTSANCTPLGAVVAGSAITAANEFTATDTISVEAASVTAFSEGAGVLFITIQ